MLLDTLGITIAAGPMEAGTIARNTAAALFAAGDDAQSARILFDGRSVSIAGAAYAAATQIDNLDGHDGYNLFLMRAMAPPEVTLSDIYRSIIPFVLVMTLGLAMVTVFPEIALWLPKYVYGR